MKGRVIEKGAGLAERRKLMGAFLESTVKVGIPRANNVQHPNSELRIADIAAIHEFGAPAANIPERSFMRAGIAEHLDAINAEQADLARLAMNKRIGVGTAQRRLGEVIAGFIKDKLLAGPFVPLTPETSRAKKHDTPLIDSGALHDAIGFEIEPRGKK